MFLRVEPGKSNTKVRASGEGLSVVCDLMGGTIQGEQGHRAQVFLSFLIKSLNPIMTSSDPYNSNHHPGMINNN